MPKFFFHLRDNQNSLSRDDMGLDFPDAETACLEAYQGAIDMAREYFANGRNPRGYALEVVNEAGDVLFELPFAEALDAHSGRRPVKQSKAVRVVKEHGERMVRLTTEVAQQVKMAQQNLHRSQELLGRLKPRTG